MSKFSIEHKPNVLADIVCLHGFLDAHTAPELESALANVIQKGQNKIIVNFGNLDYISSAGLGVFMVFIEDVRERGGDIKLSGMKPKVYTVFDLLGFPMLFDIIDSDEEAVARFQTT